MRIFHGTENANIQKPTVLTLGVFDGLHLGHQRIMQTVVERAKNVNAQATAITFDPHPRAVLHPELAPPLLQTLDQRLANFEVNDIAAFGFESARLHQDLKCRLGAESSHPRRQA